MTDEGSDSSINQIEEIDLEKKECGGSSSPQDLIFTEQQVLDAGGSKSLSPKQTKDTSKLKPRKQLFPPQTEAVVHLSKEERKKKYRERKKVSTSEESDNDSAGGNLIFTDHGVLDAVGSDSLSPKPATDTSKLKPRKVFPPQPKAKAQEERKKKKQERKKDSTPEESDDSAGGNNSSSTEEHGVEKSKTGKKTAPKRRVRSSIDEKTPDTVKKKTYSAKKRGANLVKKAQEFQDRCGGKVYLKAEYKGGKSEPYSWKFGENFKLKSDPETPEKSSPGKLLGMVANLKKTIQDSLTPRRVHEQGEDEEDDGDEQPSTSKVAFQSPRKKKGKRAASRNKDGCIICGNVKVTAGEVCYESEWVGCSYESSSGQCTGWVHGDCLGFPGATETEIGNMPPYYCRLHLSSGRRIRNVKITYDLPEGAEKSQKPKKKK